jgi:hypothetical protein
MGVRNNNNNASGCLLPAVRVVRGKSYADIPYFSVLTRKHQDVLSLFPLPRNIENDEAEDSI